MRDDKRSTLGTLLETERRFYSVLPGKDMYSKLLFRSLLWFTLFSIAYTLAVRL